MYRECSGSAVDCSTWDQVVLVLAQLESSRYILEQDPFSSLLNTGYIAHENKRPYMTENLLART